MSERPKLEWNKLAEWKRFSRKEGDERKAPKIVQLLRVSDGSYAISAQSEIGRIVIKLSRAESLELAHGILSTVEY